MWRSPGRLAWAAHKYSCQAGGAFVYPTLSAQEVDVLVALKDRRILEQGTGRTHTLIEQLKELGLWDGDFETLVSTMRNPVCTIPEPRRTSILIICQFRLAGNLPPHLSFPMTSWQRATTTFVPFVYQTWSPQHSPICGPDQDPTLLQRAAAYLNAQLLFNHVENGITTRTMSEQQTDIPEYGEATEARLYALWDRLMAMWEEVECGEQFKAYHSQFLKNSRHQLPTSPPPDVSPQALLAHYAQTPTRTIQLQELSMYGNPPLDEKTLLASAERTRVELLAGLARRVSQHLSLPFLPATNPSLSKVHNLYSSAFFNLSTVPSIKTLADNDKLCRVMSQMVEEHRDNIPLLAKGFKESRKYLPDAVITNFLDRAIRNRISLRLIAEQHLSLSAASLPSLRPSNGTTSLPSPPADKDPRIEPSARPPSSSLAAGRVGVLDLQLNPHDLISTCAEYVTLLCESTYGVSPGYRIEGAPASMTVGGVGSHLEYIMTELLKNAFRATVEHTVPKKEEHDPDEFRFEDTPHAHMMKSDFPEVVITIGAVPGALTIRIRDRGGGIPPENVNNVFSYAFTSVPLLPDPDSDPDSPGLYGSTGNAGYYGGVGGGPHGGESTLQTSVGTLAGLGFGLPLSRIYAQYFGGSLDLVSMYGWGCDQYLVLKTFS
ncbi:hypothetical protein JCM10213_007255 [Rhodosporidiobolus nylandii]